MDILENDIGPESDKGKDVVPKYTSDFLLEKETDVKALQFIAKPSFLVDKSSIILLSIVLLELHGVEGIPDPVPDSQHRDQGLFRFNRGLSHNMLHHDWVGQSLLEISSLNSNGELHEWVISKSLGASSIVPEEIIVQILAAKMESKYRRCMSDNRLEPGFGKSS
ncbi:hypothetical protein VNO78_33964 [Psophocarpus tetragonolobus]|uniref:Uncharacterized protein n=1 Tax=Psophocarpus tetragonolobus TaxID=3891 RepID=A0AAN9NZ20_PSOTE